MGAECGQPEVAGDSASSAGRTPGWLWSEARHAGGSVVQCFTSAGEAAAPPASRRECRCAVAAAWLRRTPTPAHSWHPLLHPTATVKAVRPAAQREHQVMAPRTLLLALCALLAVAQADTRAKCGQNCDSAFSEPNFRACLLEAAASAGSKNATKPWVVFEDDPGYDTARRWVAQAWGRRGWRLGRYLAPRRSCHGTWGCRTKPPHSCRTGRSWRLGLTPHPDLHLPAFRVCSTPTRLQQGLLTRRQVPTRQPGGWGAMMQAPTGRGS